MERVEKSTMKVSLFPQSTVKQVNGGTEKKTYVEANFMTQIFVHLPSKIIRKQCFVVKLTSVLPKPDLVILARQH